MRIDGPFLTNISETVEEKTDSTTTAPRTAVDSTATTESVIQHSLPKTDSVEVKTNSFFNFPDSPKLDSSQINIADASAVPAALIPGVPFREKAELPKTLPNGTSVDSG